MSDLPGIPILIEDCIFYDEFKVRDYHLIQSSIAFLKCTFPDAVSSVQFRNGNKSLYFEKCMFMDSCILTFPTTFRISNRNTFKGSTYFTISVDMSGASFMSYKCNFFGSTRFEFELLPQTGKEVEQELVFRNCILDGITFSDFCRTPIKLAFNAKCEWPRRIQFLPRRWQVICLRDEVGLKAERTIEYYFKFKESFRRKHKPGSLDDVPDENHGARKCMKAYSFLESHFYSAEQFEMAAQFRCGHLRTTRLLEEASFASKGLNYVYQLSSNYGYSLFRPLLLAFLIHIVFTTMYLSLGWNVLSASSDESGFGQYMHCFTSSIVSVAGDRSNTYLPDAGSPVRLLHLLETVLMFTLGALFVLSIRRLFVSRPPIKSS